MTKCYLHFYCFHGSQVTVKRFLGYSETMPVWMFWASIVFAVVALVVVAGKMLSDRW